MLSVLVREWLCATYARRYPPLQIEHVCYNRPVAPSYSFVAHPRIRGRTPLVPLSYRGTNGRPSCGVAAGALCASSCPAVSVAPIELLFAWAGAGSVLLEAMGKSQALLMKGLLVPPTLLTVSRQSDSIGPLLGVQRLCAMRPGDTGIGPR